ncbi:lipopolysaccharide assembly protein LapB [Mangrovimonas sp. TPBH4]|uniref:tetratricopeptide repeat protein n=1 Tax=Mangrovimonas sp. TPBH4 TaxID=1645914 RepID=UPI0006B4B654|nr:tetratricopeptide repeat protein [Mangrovimonas sp. TPBH4]
MRWLFFVIFLPILGHGQLNLTLVQTLVEEEEYTRAEVLLRPHVEDSNNLEAVELLGDVYGHQKEWDKAIVEYKKLVARQPNVANYQYKYGGAMAMKALSINKIRALGIIGDMEEAFLKAASLDPAHIDTRWALVELYVKLPVILGGGFDNAMQYANQLEKLSLVDGYLAKGLVYYNKENFRLAETYYQKALKVGGSLTCYKKLIEFYMAQGELQKALKNLQEAYAKYPSEGLLMEIKEVEQKM